MASKNDKPSIIISNRYVTISGGFWLVGWLFTIGLADLTLGRALLALVVWPYYVGAALGRL